MSISACWIVKNEAESITASIESVRNCVDELIVVDTGSTDGTVQAAEKCAAQVEHFEWTQDFSSARNYALSLASGDYVIFLDGDEHFSPSLNEADKDAIINCFKRNNADVLQIPRDEIDERGNWTGTTIHGRILRRGALKYSGRIHELPKLPDGSAPSCFPLSAYRIRHTGYAGDIRAQKALRNIAILEEALQEAESESRRFLYNAYLVREYAAVGNPNKANVNCRYLLDHNAMWLELSKDSAFDFIQFIYAAIYVVSAQRSLYSRKEVFDKLFMVIKSVYPDSRDAVLADLYYQALFDYREDRFLRMFYEAEILLTDLPPSELAESMSVESLLYSRGASAEYYRGNIKAARRLAIVSQQLSPNEDRPEIEMILHDSDPVTSDFYNTSGTGSFTDPLSEIGGYVLHAEYRKAYDLIVQQLDTGPLEHNLLRFLLIVAEKATDELAEIANDRFERSWALLSEILDLNDIISTGYVGKYAGGSEIADITFEKFLDAYSRDLSRPVTQEIIDLHILAAQRFENNGFAVAALQSYSLLFARSVAEAQRILESILRLLLDNEGGALAEQLRKVFEASI